VIRSFVSFLFLATVLLFATALIAPGQFAPSHVAKAADTDSQDPLNRTSPQSAVVAFLDVCGSKNYERAARYLDLSGFTAQKRLDEGRQLAQELEQILNRDAQFDVAALSKNPEGQHEGGLPPNRERVTTLHVNGKSVEIDLERAELRSHSFVWRFAPDSVKEIPELVIATSQSAIERHLPAPLVRGKVLDTAIWRWIALALLGGALWVLTRLISRAILTFVTPALNRISHGRTENLIEPFAGPLQLLLGVALFGAGMQWIDPSPVLRLYVGRCLAVLSVLGFAWLCARVIDLGVLRLHRFLSNSHPGLSRSVLPLSARLLKVAILALGLIAMLSNWGYNTGTILAGLGIGGIAVALASQKTIENLFGSVAVISDHPVHVGDFCKVGNQVGTVEDIGLRSTRIRTLDRTLVTIPNGEFSAMTLENFSRRDKMWLHHTLNLRRDTTPRQVRAVLESIRAILTQDSRVEIGSVPVRFVGVGAYSLDLEVFAYVLTGDGDQFLQIQQELLLKTLDAVAAAGTALALPTQASVAYSIEPEPALRK
jgi:MscS family membrane protein